LDLCFKSIWLLIHLFAGSGLRSLNKSILFLISYDVNKVF
jgi:hypothetical protein